MGADTQDADSHFTGWEAINRLISLDERDTASPTRQTLDERKKHYRVPDVSIAVLENGRIAGMIGAGETRFQAASISKPVAAMAALRLVDQGRLDLDEDVNTYLTSWRVPAIEGWQPRITIRQLVSHSAGLTVHGFPGYAQDAPIPTLTQILDGVPPANTARIRVDTVPGAQFRYSGGGYCVLQQLLMDVTGQPFPALMRDLVLRPLGMDRSSYGSPPANVPPDHIAHGHTQDGAEIPGGWHSYPEMAAAGLWTTPRDLLFFAAAFEKPEFLSPALAAEALTPQVARSASEAMGLGVVLSGAGASARFGHGGDNAGFKCHFVVFRGGKCGAAVMTNGDGGTGLIAEVLYGIAEAYDWPGFREEQVPPPVLALDVLAAYAGTYRLRPGYAFVVTHTNDRLTIAPTGQAPFAVMPRSQTEFMSWHFAATFTFVRPGEGPATALRFAQNGQEIEAVRVD